MLGREVEDDRMARVTEKGLATDGGLEDAVFALDAEIADEGDLLGDQPHDGLRVVRVEVVHDQVPAAGVGALVEQPAQEGGEVRLGAGCADLRQHHPAGHAQGGEEDAGAVADVLWARGARCAQELAGGSVPCARGLEMPVFSSSEMVSMPASARCGARR